MYATTSVTVSIPEIEGSPQFLDVNTDILKIFLDNPLENIALVLEVIIEGSGGDDCSANDVHDLGIVIASSAEYLRTVK